VIFVSIDPGKTTGYAVWRHGTLMSAGVCKPQSFPYLEEVHVNQIVIERPWIYPRGKRDHKTGLDRQINVNDILGLALIVGEIAGSVRETHGAEVVYYKPSDWKGQLPKDVHHQRVKIALSAAEGERVVLPRAKKAQADLWDAVGLGQYHNQQLKIRGMI